MKRMSIITAGIALAAILSSTSHAAVVAFDGFDTSLSGNETGGVYYETRAIFNQKTVRGGRIIGMGTTDWVVATGLFTTQMGSLTSETFGTNSTGRIDFSHHSLASRSIERQIDATLTNTTFYMSGMVRASALDSTGGSTTLDGAVMGFTDSEAAGYFYNGAFDGLMFGFDGNGTGTDLVLWGAGGRQVVASDVSTGITYHVVVEVVFNAGGDEAVKVWVNPASTTSLGAFDVSVGGDYADHLSDFSYATLFARVASIGTTSFDELTLATAFTDLFPGTEVSTPPVLQMAVNGADLDFTWNSLEGRRYVLESCTLLTNQSWSVYSDEVKMYMNIPASETGTNTLNGVRATGSARFFRLGRSVDVSQLVQKLDAGEPQTLVTYGTSLTAGGAWVSQLKEILQEQYGDLIAVENGAKAGEDSRWGVTNVEERVLIHQPDAVTIEFSMNDSLTGRSISIDEARENLLFIVQAVHAQNPGTEVFLLTMNCLGDNKLNPLPADPWGRPNLNDYYQMCRDVAQEYGLQLIDLNAEWVVWKEENPEQFLTHVPDGVHPDSYACQEVATPVIVKALGVELE